MSLQVSWVRHRDIHLLTLGSYTYTNDQRFRAIHIAQTDDWMLQIRYPQLRDSGYYECQVSTTPHMSHIVHLNVIDRVVNSGSSKFCVRIVPVSSKCSLRIFDKHFEHLVQHKLTINGAAIMERHFMDGKSYFSHIVNIAQGQSLWLRAVHTIRMVSLIYIYYNTDKLKMRNNNVRWSGYEYEYDESLSLCIDPIQVLSKRRTEPENLSGEIAFFSRISRTMMSSLDIPVKARDRLSFAGP
ncbi:uncharacterized protein LOC143343716 isoform X4 [Colletes latitarsis]